MWGNNVIQPVNNNRDANRVVNQQLHRGLGGNARKRGNATLTKQQQRFWGNVATRSAFNNTGITANNATSFS